MIELIKLYNAIISEFSKFNLNYCNKDFTVNDFNVFPTSKLIKYKYFKSYEEYYKKITDLKKKINENINKEYYISILDALVKVMQYELVITLETLEEKMSYIQQFTLINKNTIMYNLITDTYERMPYKKTVYIDLANFIQDLNKLKNKKVNIVVNHIIYELSTIYVYYFIELYTLPYILKNTDFIEKFTIIENSLKDASKIIKDISGINNIYLYDYTKDNKQLILQGQIQFYNITNINISKVIETFDNLKNQYLKDSIKNSILLKLKDDLIIIESNIQLSFNDYVALTKAILLYNITESILN